MDEDNILILGGIVMGISIMALVWIMVYSFSFNISQETGDDICKQLTGNETAIAESDDYGNLICELPSFDETQNIIIRSNSE